MMMHARPRRRPWDADDGVTLIELLVSTALLGIILAALAGTLIVTLGSVSRSEQEVNATQLASEFAESMQIDDFDYVAHYEDFATAAARPDWASRVDFGVDPPQFEGRELVTAPGPTGTPDARYLDPVSTRTIGNVEYLVEQYVTWVDRDGDGNVETKRLTTFVSWTDAGDVDRELRFESERVPTQDEATATNAGTRVIQFTVSPDRTALDPDTGETVEVITLFVRTSEDTYTGRFEYYVWDPVVSDFDLVSETANPGVPGNTTGFVTWRLTIPADTVFANGAVDIRFSATDVDGAAVTSFGTLATELGPFTECTPTPGVTSGPCADPDPSPSPSPSPSPGSGPAVAITITDSPSVLCIDPSTGKVAVPADISVFVDGLSQEDGRVDVSYPFYSEGQTGQPDQVADDSMDFVSETTVPASASYETTIVEGDQYFRKNRSVAFTLSAQRNGGLFDVDRDTASFTANVAEVGSGSC